MKARNEFIDTPQQRLIHVAENAAPWRHRAAHPMAVAAVVFLTLFAAWVLIGLLAGSGAAELFQVYAERIKELASPF